VVAAVAAAMVLGDDDGGGGGSTGPPAGVTLDDLEPALLTQADVGSSYRPDTGGDDSDDPLDSDSVDASEDCITALETFEEADAGTEEVGVDFVDDADGTIQHDIGLLGDGAPGLGDIRGAIEQCETMVFDEDGVSGEFRFEVADLDGLGDGAFGMTVTADMQTQGFDIDFQMYGVLWQRDGVLSSVAGFGGFDDATFEGLPTDQDQVRELAALADDRLAALLEG
jgi:hypothetical protein